MEHANNQAKYTNSRVWQETLGINDDKNAELLRVSFESVREKAAILADSTAERLPFFTKHDITHSDALWTAADTLLSKESGAFMLNPAEGYVLGLAFLLHDLGMGLAAYDEGLDGIRRLEYYRDSVAAFFLKDNGRPITENDWKRLDAEYDALDGSDRKLVDRAIASTLRDMHAAKASGLALLKWECKGEQFFMIENPELRRAFGELAGKLAASHGWSYDRLRDEFLPTAHGTTSILPADWTVDELKLACIVRLADAIQIDDSRAPSFDMALKNLEGESNKHWTFQNKLDQPQVRDERLLFTSHSAFKSEDMEAWWLCYDTLKSVDDELRRADALMIETGKEPFAARGVYGIASPLELAEQIKTDGWDPVDTTIHVGDVGRLVRMLGGEQLYGSESGWVPFRELIQNGSDAVRARRLIEERDEDFGRITVSFEDIGDEHFISFTDNGVGMSETVLTGPFLDFGQSFWNTPLMNSELPGLASKGFGSTGQYGIGFYSVFMWSGEVKVITKRIGDMQKTLVLEFRDSVKCRPILRKAEDNERRRVRDCGTCVIVKLNDELAAGIKNAKVFERVFNKPLAGSLANLCPALDCDLYLEDTRLVAANDWKMMPPKELVKRLECAKDKKIDYTFERLSDEEIDSLINAMKPLYDGGRMVGRGAFSSTDNAGCIVNGGIFVDHIDGLFFAGILEGRSAGAARNKASVAATAESWLVWAQEQDKAISFPKSDDNYWLILSWQIRKLGVKPQGSPICRIISMDDQQLSVNPASYCGIVDFAGTGLYRRFIICSMLDDYNEYLKALGDTFDPRYIKHPTGITFSPILLYLELLPLVPIEKYYNIGKYAVSISDNIVDAVCEGLGIAEADKEKHVRRNCKVDLGKVNGKKYSVKAYAVVYRDGIPEGEDPYIMQVITES